MTSTKQVSLVVPSTYEIDPWLMSATAEEVALVLDLASRLPRIVNDERSEINAKLDEARNKGTAMAIRQVLEEASTTVAVRYQEEVATLKAQVNQHEHVVSSLHGVQSELVEWKAKYERDLQAKNFELKGELDKIKVYEEHLRQTSELKLEALKRDISTHSDWRAVQRACRRI